MRLSTAQRSLLLEFADDGPDRYVLPRSRRTADILHDLGLLKRLLGHWYMITDEGRAEARR